MVETSLFIIPKPESSIYLQAIEEMLGEEKFRVDSVYQIKNWEEAARAIYEKQLAESSYEFRIGFEGHIRVTKILFGNESVLVTLSNPFESLEEGVKRLFTKKQEMRKRLGERGHKSLVICANLSGLESVFSGYGNGGVLGVQDKDKFKPFEGYTGVWDYFYFKFFHTSDPDEEILRREFNILADMGILSNEVQKEKWSIMKDLKTLRVPR